MGKKKSKAKKRRKKKKQQQQQRLVQNKTISELNNELEQVISRGRGRKAVALAKILLKQSEYSPEYLPAIIRAYEVRIGEMLEVGQAEEAVRFYKAIITSHPDWAGLFSLQLLIRKDFSAGTSTILGRYGKDDRITNGVAEYIKFQLQDIYLAADHPELPPEHPIKLQASSIIEGWREVEGEVEAEAGAFARMRQTIGRDSLFMDWRLLVTAIKASYEGDDKLCLACLERIPAGSSTEKISSVLLYLIQKNTVLPSGASKILREYLGPSLHSDLLEVDSLLEEDRYGKAGDKFLGIFFSPELRERTGLRRELGVLFSDKFDDAGREPPRRLAESRDSPHLLSILAFQWGEDLMNIWELLLEIGDLTPIDEALIYNRMADKMIQGVHEVSPSARFGPDKKEARSLKKRCLKEAVDLWKRSVAACPLRETYRQWYKAISPAAAVKTKEELLNRWARDFPGEYTPLLEMVVASRKRKAHTKALNIFERLDDLAGKIPEVERLRPFLHIDRAIQLLKKDQTDKAISRLEEVSSSGSFFLPTLIKVILWIVALRKNSTELKAIEENDLPGMNQPLVVRHILTVLGSYYRMKDLPAPPPRVMGQFRKPEVLMDNAELLIGLNDPVWKIDRLAVRKPIEIMAFNRTTADSSRLIGILEYIFSADPVLNNPESNMLAWPLTANGIGRRDQRLPIFLAYRCLLLDWYLDLCFNRWQSHYGETEYRSKICLRLAYQLAEEKGSASMITFIRDVAEKINLSGEALRTMQKEDRVISPEEIDKIIIRETKTPYFPPTTINRSGRTFFSIMFNSDLPELELDEE
ncbi:MAG: hypothetical protein U9N73_00285 [Candidatus Auribacterota bacterium]|nr:hypothetical protein [Candidatus Auribacterota bacterium]